MGGENIPIEIEFPLSKQEQRLENHMKIMQSLIKLCLINKQEYKNAGIILCTTEETRQLVPTKWKNKTAIMQTIGISMSEDVYRKRRYCLENKPVKRNNINIIMAGRPLYWKGYNIAVAAIKKYCNMDMMFRWKYMALKI